MKGNSKEVESNQTGIHKDLEKLVLRYLDSEYKKPVAGHTRKAFENAQNFVSRFHTPIILDSGCGTGLSTIALAKRFPENPVVGVDKSEIRLSKAENRRGDVPDFPENAYFVRAELVDFWNLALRENWRVEFHALFYPNPWPKQSELRYRFHAHPIFPVLIQLSPKLELRTNWKIYADEFRFALEIARTHWNFKAQIRQESFRPDSPISAFEKKFAESGHTLWRVAFDRKR